MIYVFDLDYTLFDGKKFNKAIAKTLGLLNKRYYESYYQYFTSAGINYNIYKHLRILVKAGTITKDKEKLIRHNILARFFCLDEFLYNGVEKILAKLENNGHEIILITYGDLAWQKFKINRLKIKKHFNKIIITDKDKDAELDYLKNRQENVIIVNDNAQESVLLKKVLPAAEIFLVKGPYANNIKHKFKIQRLSKLGKYENKKEKIIQPRNQVFCRA